jgi:hypothetical protein
MGTTHDHRWFEQSSFKFANGASVASVRDSKPYVDRAAMSARAIISTATEDRVGDILNPRGCLLKNYAKNPVVLWGHGLEGITTPIGTSCDPDDNLAIEIQDDFVLATCYFSQKSLEAAQIFELIDEGIVRATSVRETPKSFKKSYVNGSPVNLVDKWDLEEWSWCSIGVNPDAVAKAMNSRIDGRRLVPSIMKSLNAVMPAKRVTGKGMDSTMKTDKDPDNDGDDDTSAATDTDHDGGTGTPDVANNPYGAQMIAAYHAALSQANKKAESGMGAMEHPEATPAMRSALDAVKDAMTALRGAHASCYPKSVLKDMESDDGSDDESDSADSEMKAWLLKGCNSLTLQGASRTLKSFVRSPNLTTSQRQLLSELADGFSRWNSQAKSLRAMQQSTEKSKPTTELTAEQQAAIDAAFAKLTAS